MSRSFFGLLGVAVLAAFAIAEDAKPGTTLGKDIRVPANIGFSTTVTADQQVATLVFDNLSTDINPVVQGARGALNQTASQSRVFTVNIPYTTDQRSVKMFLDLRGYVSSVPGATVRLVACAGDATQVIDLTAKKDVTVKLKGKSKEALPPEQASQLDGDFQDRVEFTLQVQAATPVCQITLFLLAEHDTDKANTGGALLVVDSLDLSINPIADAKLKP